MKTIQRIFRLDRSEIAFVKFIFEAYDGVANLTTLDRQMGIVRLNIAPGCDELALKIIEDLQKTIRIEPWRPITMGS
jgi:hypothetical protein